MGSSDVSSISLSLWRIAHVIPEIQEFWTCLHSQQGDEVPYLSRQNDSLREEFPSLLEDVPEMISLAKEVCGNDPEAVNLWIGDDRSVSSCHKDPYENFYVVVRGEKVFTLLPPASAPFLHETDFPAATYIRKSDGKLEAVLDDANDPVACSITHFEGILTKGQRV